MGDDADGGCRMCREWCRDDLSCGDLGGDYFSKRRGNGPRFVCLKTTHNWQGGCGSRRSFTAFHYSNFEFLRRDRDYCARDSTVPSRDNTIGVDLQTTALYPHCTLTFRHRRLPSKRMHSNVPGAQIKQRATNQRLVARCLISPGALK